MAILQRTGVTGSLSISSSRIPRSTSASLFSVNGYNGRLINVVDSLSGSLFSVNSIAGLPIFEVFSNNRIVAGKYNANDFVISGSRVGIGTTSPAAKLAVAGAGTGFMLVGNSGFTGNFTAITLNNGTATTSYNLLSSPTDTTLYVNRPSGGNINFREANSDQMTLLSGGNLGIGTTSPDGKLSVIQSNTYSSFRSNGVGAYTFLSVGRTSSEFEVGVSGGTNQFFTGTTAGDAVLKSITGKLHLGYSSAAPAITIDTSNNVGIGAVNPASRLHISSSTTTSLRIETKVNSAADSEIEFVGPDTHSYAMGIDESDSDKFKISYAASRTPPVLGTNDRFVIQTNGNVGIGTTVAEDLLSVGNVNIGANYVGYQGIWLNGGVATTDFNFLSSTTDTNLYINCPSGKGIYTQIANINTYILTAAAARFNVPIGIAMDPTYTLDVTGTLRTTGDVGLGGAPDSGARLYVQGEALTEPFLSVQTCLGNNSTNSSFYTSFKGWLAVKIGNNVGTAGNLLTTGTYYIRLWG